MVTLQSAAAAVASRCHQLLQIYSESCPARASLRRALLGCSRVVPSQREMKQAAAACVGCIAVLPVALQGFSCLVHLKTYCASHTLHQQPAPQARIARHSLCRTHTEHSHRQEGRRAGMPVQLHFFTTTLLPNIFLLQQLFKGRSAAGCARARAACCLAVVASSLPRTDSINDDPAA